MTIDTHSAATALLAALRAGDISATELLDLHLARIAEVNPTLNAIVTTSARLTKDARARARATDADANPKNPNPNSDPNRTPRPLDGLPLTIKDTIDVAGLPTTAGDPARAAAIADRDAPAARRLLSAGGILLGKTNVPTHAGDWQTDNRLFGRTGNPWDPERTPGGSTGGGAAAVAAGLSPLELGSDTGGSIRIPAAFCGIFGHRPSGGLVPSSGHFPGDPLPNPGAVMMVMGPLARSAGDLELALDVLQGPIRGDDAAWRVDLPPPRATRLADLRIAILPWADWLPVDHEVQAALEDLAASLPGPTATANRITQPDGFDLWAQAERYSAMLAVQTLSRLPAEVRAIAEEQLREAPEPLAPASLRGLRATAGDYLEMLAERARVQAGWRRFFRDFDLLLAPNTIVNAFPHTGGSFRRRRIEVNGTQEFYGRLDVYAGIASYSGLPATSFPTGRFTRTGLPIGLQVIGPQLGDRTPLQFARLAERELGCAYKPPPPPRPPEHPPGRPPGASGN